MQPKYLLRRNKQQGKRYHSLNWIKRPIYLNKWNYGAIQSYSMKYDWIHNTEELYP